MLNRRRFLKTSTGILGLNGTAPYILLSQKTRKNLNLLVITIDTLRWDHVGYNNQKVGWIKDKKKEIITPNIDYLAERAAIFDRHYIGSFPTIPQRNDCFTGNVNFPRYDWKRLGKDEIVLTELLHDNGYYTGLISDMRSIFVSKFDRAMDDSIFTYKPPEKKPDPLKIPMPGKQENYRRGSPQRNEQLADMAHFKKESDWWVARTMTTAADWLKQNAKRDKWFLWIDTFEVHEVWNPPKKYIDMYDPDYKGGIDYDYPNYDYADTYNDAELHHMWARYAGEVTLTDIWLGKVLDELDDQDLWENTMVVLQSDHGIHLGEHNYTGKHTVRREDPWPLFEEVTHIPHLVWAPVKGLPKRIPGLTQSADLMPTFLEAAGIKGPKTYGKSYLELLTGKKKNHWDIIFSSWNSPPLKEKYTVGLLTATANGCAYIAREKGHPAQLYTRARVKRREIQKEVADFMKKQGADEEYVKKFQ